MKSEYCDSTTTAAQVLMVPGVGRLREPIYAQLKYQEVCCTGQVAEMHKCALHITHVMCDVMCEE